MAHNSSNGSSSFASEEHRARQLGTEQGRAHEHDSSSQVGSENSPSLGGRLLSDSSIGSGANRSMRVMSLQAMQQTHGNRAVQRFVQRSADSSSVSSARVPVQREWDAATEGKKLNQLTSDVYDDEGTWNVIQAIPALGNVVSAAGGIINLGAAGVSKIMGEDDLASKEVSNAGYDFLHAIPFLGNYLAGRDASRAYDNADKALAGDKSVVGRPGWRPPTETAQDKFHNTGVWDYIKGNF